MKTPIEVIAPASRCTDVEYQKSIQFLEKNHFDFFVPPDLFQDANVFVAAPVKKRFDFLLQAMKRNMKRGGGYLWAIRGGYGCLELVPHLMSQKKKFLAVSRFKKKISTPFQFPSVLLGLSDLTVLHVFFNQVLKMPTLHCGVLFRYGMEKAPLSEQQEILGLLNRSISHVQFPNLKAVNRAAKNWMTSGKTLKGHVVGGNLTTLESLIGTGLHPKTKDTFLFLEDIGERGYRLHRSLNHLEQAGLFKNQRAILLGDFTGGDEPAHVVDSDARNKGEAVVNHVDLALQTYFEKLSIPVFSGVTTGHGVLQRPLPFLCPSRIQKNILRVECDF